MAPPLLYKDPWNAPGAHVHSRMKEIKAGHLVEWLLLDDEFSSAGNAMGQVVAVSAVYKDGVLVEIA